LIVLAIISSAFTAKAQLTVVALDEKDACDGLNNGSISFWLIQPCLIFL